jgi:hypothetical protein
VTDKHVDPALLPHESDRDRAAREGLAKLLASSPIPEEYLIDNLPLYLRRGQLADLLSIVDIYRMVVDVPGVVMEFGVLHGRHLAAFTALRGVFEPYNASRRIIGFDTFSGFPDIADVDDVSTSAVVGRFATAPGYPDHLRAVLDAHQAGEHLGHVQRNVVVQGDVRETLPRYLAANPQTVIALAYLDMDLYEPTRAVLEMIEPYLTVGSVVAFDELAHAKWPGETAAVREVLGLARGALRVLPHREPPLAYLRWPG